MAGLFLFLYDFFSKRRLAFWITFFLIVGLLGLGASRITLEEDITKFFPDDERVEKLNYVFQNSKFVERMVVMVSVKDSSSTAQPDSLVAFANRLSERMAQDLKPFIREMTTQVDDEKVMSLFASVHEHLPVFLDDQDYTRLDSLLQPDKIASTLEENYRQLISPAGMVIKKIIVKDPLGFS